MTIAVFDEAIFDECGFDCGRIAIPDDVVGETGVTYAEWPHEFVYPVTNPVTVDGTPVLLVVAWKPGMRQDFRDLRFRSPDLRRCPYEIVSYTAGVSASVWIALFAGQQRVSMLFGNGAAVSESSPAGVFLLEDLFSGSALDTEAWTPGGTVSVGSGVASIAASSSITSVATFGDGTAVTIVCTPANIYYPISVGYGSGANPTMRWVWDSLLDDSRSVQTVTASTQATNFGPPAAGAHVFEIARRPSAGVRYSDNGTFVIEHAAAPSSAAAPIVIAAGAVNSMTVDSVRVRRYQYPEPALGTPRQGLNPWYPLLSRYIDRGIPAAFADQRLLGYSVSRAIGDSLWSMSGRFDTTQTYGIQTFGNVDLVVPDHQGIDRRIWFGFIPEFGFSHADADDETEFVGYGYEYFLATRPLPLDMVVMPAGTNPGTLLRDYFDDVTEWGGAAVKSDTNHIRDVPGWGTTVAARDIAGSDTMSVLRMCETISDALDWVFFVRWCDVGTTPTLTHQTPAYRIIRTCAESYIAGGNNVAYYTSSGTLQIRQKPDGTGAYIRTAYPTPAGAAEWVKYAVSIPVAGTWTVALKAAYQHGEGTPSISVLVDDVLAATLELPQRDAASETLIDFNNLPWTATADIVLTAADHEITIRFDPGYGRREWFEAFDLVPPIPTEPVPPIMQPAIYFVDAEDIDDAANGLDLPPMVTISDPDPHLVGKVQYRQAFAEVANAVSVRYQAVAGTTSEAIARGIPSVGGWIFHTETLDGTATEADAQALAAELLDFYATTWGQATATFTKRTDLQYLQKIRFVGHDGVPDDVMRITSIRYSITDADVEVSIVAMPDAKWSFLRRLHDALDPNQVSEVEKIIDDATGSPDQILGWGAISFLGEVSGADRSVNVTLDGGAIVTATVWNAVLYVDGGVTYQRGVVVGDYGQVYRTSKRFVVTRPASV